MEEQIREFMYLVVTLIVLCLIYFAINIDENRKKRFRKKMMRKILNVKDNGEFDIIYNQLIKNCNMNEVKNEQRKNLIKSFVRNIILTFPSILVMIVTLFFFFKFYKRRCDKCRENKFYSFTNIFGLSSCYCWGFYKKWGYRLQML